MKLYSYIITHDTEFSPNPFWGYCTLADCKPAIRRTASVGDWVVGLSPKAHGHRLVYAMQVQEVLTYDRYFVDSRFAAKIPDFSQGKTVYKCGDNIYRPLPDGGFQQCQSMHSCGRMENPDTKARDLSGRNVLVSKNYYYFGSQGPHLPNELHELKVGRAHKNRFSDKVISVFLRFIADQLFGINAPPSKWPRSDDTWRTEGL